MPHVYRISTLIAFFLAALCVSVAAVVEEDSPSAQQKNTQAINGGLVVSADLFTPIGASVYNAFLQPSVGYVHDGPNFFGEIRTMAPFLPFESIFAVLNTPLTGMSPYFGRRELLSMRGRWAVLGRKPPKSESSASDSQGGAFRLDLGPSLEVVSMSAGYFPDDLDPSEGIPADVTTASVSALYANIGASAGTSIRRGITSMSGSVNIGNGWSSLSSTNPFFGLDLMLRISPQRRFAFQFSLAARMQHMNYENFTYSEHHNPNDFDVPEAEWLPSVTAQASIVIPLVSTRSW